MSPAAPTPLAAAFLHLPTPSGTSPPFESQAKKFKRMSQSNEKIYLALILVRYVSTCDMEGEKQFGGILVIFPEKVKILLWKDPMILENS